MEKCAWCGKEGVNDGTCLCEECQKSNDDCCYNCYHYQDGCGGIDNLNNKCFEHKK